MNSQNKNINYKQHSKTLVDMWIWGESPLRDEFDESLYIDFSLQTGESRRVKNDMDDLFEKWLLDENNDKYPFLLQIKGVVGSGKTTTVMFFRNIIKNVNDVLFKDRFDRRIFHFPINISENRVQFRKKGFLSHFLSTLIEILMKILPEYLEKLFSKLDKRRFLDKKLSYGDIIEDLEIFLAEYDIKPPEKLAKLLYYLGIDKTKKQNLKSLNLKVYEIQDYYTSSKNLKNIYEKVLTFFDKFRDICDIPIIIFTIDNWDLIEQNFFTEVYLSFNNIYESCLKKNIPFSLIMGASDEFYNDTIGRTEHNIKLFNHFLYPKEYQKTFKANYRNHINLPDKLVKEHTRGVQVAIETIFKTFELYKQNFPSDKLLEYKKIVTNISTEILTKIKINELFSIISNLLLNAIEKNQPKKLFEIDLKVHIEFLKIRTRKRVKDILNVNIRLGLIRYYELNGYNIILTHENEVLMEDNRSIKTKLLFLNKLTSNDYDEIIILQQRFENFHLIVRNSKNSRIYQKMKISDSFKRKIFLNGLSAFQITSLNMEQEIMLDLLPELEKKIRNFDDSKLFERFIRLMKQNIQL